MTTDRSPEGGEPHTMGEELDKLTTTLSTMLDQQSKDLDRGIRSLADALRQAADRVAAYAPGAPPPAAVTAAVTAAGTAAASAGGGILAVRVVNDLNAPVPVVATGAAQRQESRGGGVWGAVTGIAGGIGSLVGGVVGGFLGGGLGGPVLVAGLIALVARLTELAVRIDGLLNRFYAFTRTVFGELTTAGIFPVSQLFASLLLFIDLGVSVVLAHLGTVINWVEKLFASLVDWLGKFVDALGHWVGRTVNRLGPYLTALLAHLLEHVVRPYVVVITLDATRKALEALASVLLGSSYAMANVIVEAFKYAAAWVLNAIATSQLGPIGAVLFPPPPPLGPSIGKAISDGMAEGTKAGESWTRKILGPPGATPAPGTPGAPPPAPDKLPTFKVPGFTAPELTLPKVPDITPQLQNLVTGRPPTPAASTTTAAPQSASPLTLNGGVHITIAAESVDAEHADETARHLARSMLDELRRLAERERFRVGLPTSAAP
ncbi:hypothetical protein [Streptomyces fulvoviolaceus]|uniref:hypothetical protein n=1 Tax=Streptomyces fulvoviolaceus TaxID=285535 RepID=UPI00131DF9F9|nr:hypothetical protein [Streptomyces fulvoviolaceus]